MNAKEDRDRLNETRARVAIDLGAESCRVSLLRWRDGRPEIKDKGFRIRQGIA